MKETPFTLQTSKTIMDLCIALPTQYQIKNTLVVNIFTNTGNQEKSQDVNVRKVIGKNTMAQMFFCRKWLNKTELKDTQEKSCF